MKVRTGDRVVLADGKREKEFVVLGFTRFHVELAPVSDFNLSVEKYGSYNTTVFGFATFPIRGGGVQKGFWQMLKSVNGKTATHDERTKEHNAAC